MSSAAIFGIALLLLPSIGANGAAPPEPHAPVALAQGDRFILRAELSGDNEVPPVTTTASGDAVFVLDEDGETLHVRLTVNGLENATMAHLHTGAPGVNGPPAVWLYDATGTNAPGGDLDDETPLRTEVTLTTLQMAELMAEGFYINVHTTANTGGEIRGQVLIDDAPETLFGADLTGDNEVPPVDTSASGFGVFEVTGDMQALEYELSVDEISDITQAHLHVGLPGANGPVTLWLYDVTGANAPGGPFEPGANLVAATALDSDVLADMLSGLAYANVHTDAHGSGEIRGPLMDDASSGEPEPPIVYAAHLTGDNEVPPVTTSAQADAIFVLDQESNELHVRMNALGFDNDITQAHLHIGGAGVNGPVSVWLYDATGANAPGGPFDETNPLRHTVVLDPSQVAALGVEGLYANIHTADHGAGEVRGQVEVYDGPTLFSAELSGTNEVPPVTTTATAQADFELILDMTTLAYEIDVDGMNNIMAAHLHQGLPGVNGPPVLWLYDASGTNAPGGPFGPDDPVSGEVEIGPSELADLLAGHLYANIHTMTHPDGEVRGQVLPPTDGEPPSLTLLQAELDGAAHSPPVDTEGEGEALFVFDESDMTLHYRIYITATAAVSLTRLHAGSPGINGPEILTIYDVTGESAPGGDFDAEHPLRGSIALTSEVAAALQAGLVYVNVITDEHPAGEIRGQLVAYSGPTVFEVAPSGAQEVPPVETEGGATARFELDDDLEFLHYELEVRDITGATGAHLHRGLPGVNGPVVVWLYDRTGENAPAGPLEPGSPVTAAVALAADEIADLLGGFFYVNIHTPAHPGGEVRAQIASRFAVPEPPPGEMAIRGAFRASLEASSEVPPVSSDASGLAYIVYESDSSVASILAGEQTTPTHRVSFHIAVEAIAGITQAHLHRGAAGVNGPVVVWLYDRTGQNAPGGPFEPGSPIAGTAELSADIAADLVAGNLYLNVHTDANPSGEIRGQVRPYVPPARIDVQLSGDNEVPPVTTAASGSVQLVFTGGLEAMGYDIAVESITGTLAAHIHRGYPDENGPVLIWLYDRTGQQAPGGDLAPGSPISGTFELTAELLADLLGGALYINVHTVQHTGGEIRGQITVTPEPEESLIYLPYVEVPIRR